MCPPAWATPLQNRRCARARAFMARRPNSTSQSRLISSADSAQVVNRRLNLTSDPGIPYYPPPKYNDEAQCPRHQKTIAPTFIIVSGGAGDDQEIYVCLGSEVKFSRLGTVWNTRTHTTVINHLTRSERLACIFSRWSGLARSERLACIVSKWSGGGKSSTCFFQPCG